MNKHLEGIMKGISAKPWSGGAQKMTGSQASAKPRPKGGNIVQRLASKAPAQVTKTPPKHPKGSGGGSARPAAPVSVVPESKVPGPSKRAGKVTGQQPIHIHLHLGGSGSMEPDADD